MKILKKVNNFQTRRVGVSNAPPFNRQSLRNNFADAYAMGQRYPDEIIQKAKEIEVTEGTEEDLRIGLSKFLEERHWKLEFQNQDMDQSYEGVTAKRINLTQNNLR